MKKLTKLAAAVALSAVVLGSFSTNVSAQTTVSQEQELDQTVRVNCTTGAYGQNTTCTAEGSQNGRQSQTVVIEGVRYFVRNDGTRLRVHTPVNTSVNSTAMAGMIAAAVATAGAGLLTLKKQK